MVKKASVIEELIDIPCLLSTPFRLSDVRDCGVKQKLEEQLPVAVSRFFENTHIKFKRLNVIGDGNCGAFCLSVLHYSLTGEVLHPSEIRDKLAEICNHQCNTLSLRERAFYKESVTSSRYLEAFDMGLFLMHYSINTAVFSQSMDKRHIDEDSRKKQHYTIQVAGYSPHNQLWVFLLLTNSNRHWQLLVRPESTTSGICPTFGLIEAFMFFRVCNAKYPQTATNMCRDISFLEALNDDLVPFESKKDEEALQPRKRPRYTKKSN